MHSAVHFYNISKTIEVTLYFKVSLLQCKYTIKYCAIVQALRLLLETAVTRRLSNISAWAMMTFRWRPCGPCLNGKPRPLCTWTCMWPPSQKWYTQHALTLNAIMSSCTVASSLNTYFLFLSTEWKSPEPLDTSHNCACKCFQILFARLHTQFRKLAWFSWLYWPKEHNERTGLIYFKSNLIENKNKV